MPDYKPGLYFVRFKSGLDQPQEPLSIADLRSDGMFAVHHGLGPYDAEDFVEIIGPHTAEELLSAMTFTQAEYAAREQGVHVVLVQD